MVRTRAKIFVTAIALALACGLPVVLTASSATSSTAMAGVVVPLYAYPTSSSWTTLMHVKQTYPSVPMIAIISPNGGAGSIKDPIFVSGIKSLQRNGIKVLGYVSTRYGSQSLSVIRTQMLNYKIWYGVNGIFYDEMSQLGTKLSYYSSLATYAKSLGFEMTIGNPGTTVSSNLLGVFSNLCIYESPGMPAISNIDGYASRSRQGFSYISYGVSSLPSQAQIKSTTTYVGYIYITSLSGSNPFDALPSYFSKEVAMLAA
jgi:Spherulation-specific family 4